MIPLLIALAAGALAALGFEPYRLWPLTLVGAGALAALVETAPTPRRAAWCGWLFGVGHFTIGLTWIAKAFTFQAKMPAVLGWVAVFGLSMYLALFVALACWLARSSRAHGLAAALVLAGCWVLGEWLRGWVLTGFAWNPLGSAWLPAPGMGQLAAVIGALGLSGLVVVAGGSLWRLVAPGATRGARGRAAILLLGVIGLGGLGARRQGEVFNPDNPLVFIVQPNIGQDIRYVAEAQAAHLQTYLDLTASAFASEASPAPDIGLLAPGPDRFKLGPDGRPRRPPAVVIWPEGAVLEPVEDDPVQRARLTSALLPGDLLIFGGTGLVRAPGGRVRAYANSLFVLDSTGRIVGRYDKAHLVPLGEYVPARPLMEAIGLARLVPGDYDFIPGPGPRSLKLPGFPEVGAVICYEVIFAAGIVGRTRPGWIVNVSNDAWFDASGAVQHLAQARLRAIEQGLPVLRATPTGVSAVINPYGEVRASQPPGVRGVLSATLPPMLPPTFYARFGDITPLLLAGLLALLGIAIQRRWIEDIKKAL